TALAATLNWQTHLRRYIFAAGILFNVAVSVGGIFVLNEDPFASPFLLTNLIAASLSGILWLWLELRSRRLRHGDLFGPALSFHNLSAIASLALLTLIVVVKTPLLYAPQLSWIAFFSLLIFMAACLWDRYAKLAVASLYILGLLGCATPLLQLELSPLRFPWAATIVLATYTLLTALLWHWRRRLIDFAQQFG